MAIDRNYIEQGWLDGAIHHLDLLYQESQKYEDEGDILPTVEGIKSAKMLMSKLTKAAAPRIAVTVNGEVILMWEINGDDFIARVATDGSTKFYKDNIVIEQRMFIKYLGNMAAA